MKGLGLVLFIIAIQIISAIIAHKKKQNERKAREDALRQRVQVQTGLPLSTPAGATATIAPPAASGASVDLESRRASQLEQLRQRRESRRDSIADSKAMHQSTQARRGMPSPTQVARRVPPTIAVPSRHGSEKERIRAQEAARQARDAERLRREQQARASAEQQEAEELAAHKAYERSFHSVAGEADAVSHGASPAVRAAAAIGLGGPGAGNRVEPAASALMSRLREPASLREIVLLREILDKPVSLRN